jgi:glyoxylase-like metal-dependent hydrolase (beta-lactamase superfamily II)
MNVKIQETAPGDYGSKTGRLTEDLGFDVLVIDQPEQSNGVLPNGERKGDATVASTLIYGREDAVLTDPAFTTEQAKTIGDWVDAHRRNLTDIFVTHGHGDHWFGAELLAARFGARIVATSGTITQMHAAIAARPLLWDKVYPGIPSTSVKAVTVPDNRLPLEGHECVIVEVGRADTEGNTVLHIPDLQLVVAGDVIYNGAHMYLGESFAARGFNLWRKAIDKVVALNPSHIVCGHQNRSLDDAAARTIAETRQYLAVAEHLLTTESTAEEFFFAMINRYPDYVARTVLWASASGIYGVREHPGDDVAQLLLAGWL